MERIEEIMISNSGMMVMKLNIIALSRMVIVVTVTILVIKATITMAARSNKHLNGAAEVIAVTTCYTLKDEQNAQ